MKKKAPRRKPVIRSKARCETLLFLPWNKIPPHAKVHMTAIAEVTGVSMSTVYHHMEKGLLPRQTYVSKADIEKWFLRVRDFGVLLT